MKHYRKILAPLLVGPVLVAFTAPLALPLAELKFAPSEGATVSLTIEQTSEVSLDDMTMVQNGQEIDMSMMGDIEMTMNMSQTVTVTDEYMALDGARPTKLKRTFEALEGQMTTSMSNPMIGDQETDVGSSSELEGATVLFTWDPEDDDYSVAFAEGEGDEELLEGLEADLTFRDFLPSGEVSEGDSWEVDPMAMRSALAPAGELKLEPDEAPEDPMMGGGQSPSPDRFLRDIEGSVKATFKGNRDVDGVKVAVIALEFDISAAADMTDEMAEAMADADLGQEGMEMQIDAFDLEFSYAGEGELHWNPQANVAHALVLSGEVELIIDQAMNMTIPGMGEMAMEQAMTLAGNQSVKIHAGR